MNAPDTIGDCELCAWTVSERPPVVRVQSSLPTYAQKLKARADGRLVAWGCTRYLRVFEFPHGLLWAKRLVRRYRSTGTGTGGALSPQEWLQTREKLKTAQ